MNNKGFTLLELLIVVLLVGILGAIALPQYFNVLERQRAMEALGILSSIEKAQVRYYAINDTYSTDFSNIDFDLRENTNGSGDDNVSGNNFQTQYFKYTLESSKATAKRNTNDFTLSVTYAAGDDGQSVTCCTPGNKADICDIINMKVCS